MSISTKLLTATLILISTAFGAAMNQASATDESKAPTTAVQQRGRDVCVHRAHCNAVVRQTNAMADILARVQDHISKKSVTELDFNGLSEFLRKSPDDFRAHKLLGDCYAATGMLALSEAEYHTSMAQNPDRDDLLIAAITRKYKQQGLLAVEQELRLLQDKFPDSPVIVLIRVQLMLARDNDWGAAHVCDVWERTRQDKFSLPTARAMVYYQNKQYTDALNEVEQDLRRRPDFLPAVALKKKIMRCINS